MELNQSDILFFSKYDEATIDKRKVFDQTLNFCTLKPKNTLKQID